MKMFMSIDLEHNPDGSFSGIREVMNEIHRIIPNGTIFVTKEICEEDSNLIEQLASKFEVGLHLHPEYEHGEELKFLTKREQEKLIRNGKQTIEDTIGREIHSFRAGRHSINKDTLEVLKDNDIKVDASLNPNYNYDFIKNYPNKPFELLNGLLEVPTTMIKPPLLSKLGIFMLPYRGRTATANTIRNFHNRELIKRLHFMDGERFILMSLKIGLPYYSIYFHPYDFMSEFKKEPISFTFLSYFVSEANSCDYEFIKITDWNVPQIFK